MENKEYLCDICGEDIIAEYIFDIHYIFHSGTVEKKGICLECLAKLIKERIIKE